MNEAEAKEKLTDKNWRMSHLYKIKTKDKRLITLVPNRAQSDYFRKRTDRNIILKARQLGFSTGCLVDILDDTITNKNTNSAIIAHERDKVVKLFEIVRRGYERLPDELKPRASFDNRNELYFPSLDSKIFVTLDTRSETVHNLHVSELAFINNAEEKMVGILESVPKGGKITYESTANGMTGYFHEEWEDPSSSFKKHFYNWMWEKEYCLETLKSIEELQEEYRSLAIRYNTIPDIFERFKLTKEQFAWYIDKLRHHKYLMVQEHPTTDLEAFISSGRNVFHISDIQKHQALPPIDRKYGDMLVWEQPLMGFKYVIGCDPAEGIGQDNSVIEVLNAFTGEQVAEFASNSVAPSLLGGYLVEIGRFYNNAFIVLEINNHGVAVMDAIKTKYMNIYRRPIIDKVSRETREVLGWKTSGTTKPLLVDNLEEATREESIKINSADCLKEMKTFVQTDEQGKQGFGAEGSNKDDRVIALGLAIQGMRKMPMQQAPKTLAQQRLEEFIEGKQLEKHGIQPENLTSRNRRKYKIRK